MKVISHVFPISIPTDIEARDHDLFLSIKQLWACSKSFDSREEWGDLTQSYDKSPCIHRNIQQATGKHKNTTKNFDYTTIDLGRSVGVTIIRVHMWDISLHFLLTFRLLW